MQRPNSEIYFLSMATLVASRSTCRRRSVGCVLVNGDNHILATGYNGVASGLRHCVDKACSGASYASGKELDKCEAIHAEQNAILQCQNVLDIKTAYMTLSPCVNCIKLFLNTNCKSIIFLEDYTNDKIAVTKAANLWLTEKRRKWKQANESTITAVKALVTVDVTR